MKLYKKIDLYFRGDYLCSTNQSKTCKEAIKKYIESADSAFHSIAGCTLTQKVILNNKDQLKARFSK